MHLCKLFFLKCKLIFYTYHVCKQFILAFFGPADIFFQYLVGWVRLHLGYKLLKVGDLNLLKVLKLSPLEIFTGNFRSNVQLSLFCMLQAELQLLWHKYDLQSFHGDRVTRVLQNKAHVTSCKCLRSLQTGSICLLEVYKLCNNIMPLDGEIPRSSRPHLECPTCYAR